VTNCLQASALKALKNEVMAYKERILLQNCTFLNTLLYRWCDGDIFVMNMTIKLESVIKEHGQDPDTHIIITRDCLTINGTFGSTPA
jgi:hypothetical protein